MEFVLDNFVKDIRETLYREFPYEGEYLKSTKHKKTPEHIRYIAFWQNDVIVGDNMMTFDIGNEQAEEKYPYYHILEDAPVIRKKGQGTEKTRGSQAQIQDLKSRNYGFVQWNGKTFTKEYQRNVRGSRNRLSSVSHWATYLNGNKVFVNREANAYQNVHYKYIERILNTFLPTIAQDNGLRMGRTQDTGLAEELAMDWNEPIETVLDIFGSFME